MTTREDVVRKLVEAAAVNLSNTGFSPPWGVLWVMKHPDTGERKAEPGLLSVPPPRTQAEVEPWFQDLERKAVELDAVAAALVVEAVRPRERSSR